ncbi:hypothetical protein QO5_2212 [Clostridioides difficile F253]|nr:hypothetical protein QO5_2212 [Clostridioides difficile F253]
MNICLIFLTPNPTKNTITPAAICAPNRAAKPSLAATESQAPKNT